jgi:hypothetical protein
MEPNFIQRQGYNTTRQCEVNSISMKSLPREKAIRCGGLGHAFWSPKRFVEGYLQMIYGRKGDV